MRKRTRKVLSIVLASAMVLSMHSMAFAAESTGSKNEVTYDNGKVVIRNAEDPLSWNSSSGWTDAFDELTGHVEDDHLINGKKKTVSTDGYSASRNVIPLEGAEGSYLLFGYGTNNYGTLPVEGEGKVPVTAYDGRKKAFKGESSGKDDAFYGVLALVKYDSSAKTITKVDGVELADFKMDKNNLHATISGSAIKTEKEGYVYKKLEGKTTPTFTLKAKVKGKDIDKTVKKAINTALKKATFKYEILPLVVGIGGYGITDENGKLSENTVDYYSGVETNLTASKLNTKNAKANLTYSVSISTKKGTKHVDKKINPKDYTLKSETVGDQTILILDEFKTTDIEYSSAEEYDDHYNFAKDGYKLCFREHGEKKNKTVRYGIYKSATDVFVTSVE